MILTLNHMSLEVPIPASVAADPKLLDGGHPLYYVLKRPHQTETYLNQVHELLKDLPPCDVLEFCAGIGLVCASNSHLLDMNEPVWDGVELDPNCEPLAELIAPGMDFHLGDMYNRRWTDEWKGRSTPGDKLVICEFSSNTLPKLWREPKRADMMWRIVQDICPEYLYIADVGYYWIHLANHWPLYEKRFGVKPTRENYHVLFDQFTRDTWGYSVTKWTVGGGAQYFLLEPI